VPVHTHIEMAALEDAEQALDRLRAGQVRGAMVLRPYLTRSRRGQPEGGRREPS
jgi:hypothetical protein